MHEPSSPSARIATRKRRQVRTVAILPTLITLGNAVCGFLSMTHVAAAWMSPKSPEALAHFHSAAWLIFVAMIFDALDGKVARMTRTASNFGAQLDSLCDFLTFGVAPAFLTYGMWTKEAGFAQHVVQVLCIFYFCCAVVRLARFNVETGTDDKFHHSFHGLPSPAAAGVVASIVLPWEALPRDWAMVQNVVTTLRNGLPIILFLLGILMVSRVAYPHVVNKLFRGVRPFVTLVELAVVAMLGVIFHEFALFLAFFGYAAMGPILWARNRIFKKAVANPARGTEPPANDPLF